MATVCQVIMHLYVEQARSLPRPVKGTKVGTPNREVQARSWNADIWEVSREVNNPQPPVPLKPPTVRWHRGRQGEHSKRNWRKCLPSTLSQMTIPSSHPLVGGRILGPRARPSLRLCVELDRISWNWVLENDVTQNKIDRQPN